jgi:hypothetical protein
MESSTEVLMALVRNTHERVIAAPAEVLGELTAALGGDRDRLWPSPEWMPLRLDRPPAVGAAGGHGPIRYRVSEYEPGHRVRFEFDPRTGIRGFHEFTVEPHPYGSSVLRHRIEASLGGRTRLMWPLVIRPIHDALIEDLFDNAEHAATGRRPAHRRWSPWVRLLRRFVPPRVRSRPVPEAARLARTAFEKEDHADALSVDLRPGISTDPQEWADAVFRDPPRWVLSLLVLREALVGLVGIERAGHAAFDTVDSLPGEVLLGTDSGHLDFRASVLVEEGPGTVTLSTVVRLHNRRGRLYWTVVRPLHPLVVRAMLRRAAHRLTQRASAARNGTRAQNCPLLGGLARPGSDHRRQGRDRQWSGQETRVRSRGTGLVSSILELTLPRTIRGTPTRAWLASTARAPGYCAKSSMSLSAGSAPVVTVARAASPFSARRTAASEIRAAAPSSAPPSRTCTSSSSNLSCWAQLPAAASVTSSRLPPSQQTTASS